MPRYEPMGYYFDTGRILHTNSMDYYVVHVHLVDMLLSTRPFVTTMCGLSSSLAPLLTLRFSTCVPTEYLSHGLIHEKLVLISLCDAAETTRGMSAQSPIEVDFALRFRRRHSRHASLDIRSIHAPINRRS